MTNLPSSRSAPPRSSARPIRRRVLGAAVLALILVVAYVAIASVVGVVVGGDTRLGGSVVASIVVAVSFQPTRRWVDRIVGGAEATPYDVLAQFSLRVAALSDVELLRRIPQLLVEATGASEAALWVRSGDGFETAETWPTSASARRLPEHAGFEDPASDVSVPVLHDGDVLGGISLRNDGARLVPSSEALVVDLASALGLALRNASLSAESQKQIAELEASRERILASADSARRALERELEGGPLQTLVAVKVKLGPMAKRAEHLGAGQTASLLAQLDGDAAAAITAVRDFGSGSIRGCSMPTAWSSPSATSPNDHRCR